MGACTFRGYYPENTVFPPPLVPCKQQKYECLPDLMNKSLGIRLWPVSQFINTPTQSVTVYAPIKPLKEAFFTHFCIKYLAILLHSSLDWQ